MRQIAITQRVHEVSSYAEKRDALDQRWVDFFLTINLMPVLVPNNIEYVEKLVTNSEIYGVLLTGGQSLEKYGGNVPERDEVEFYLLDWALKNNLPLLGVCRGMQVIQDFFNNELNVIENHVAVRHSLIVENDCRLSRIIKRYKDVNSFHNYGTKKISNKLKKIASSMDGVIMALEHQQKNIFGVMWHMERELPFSKIDQDLVKGIFS